MAEVFTNRHLAEDLFMSSRDVLRQSDRCGIVRNAIGRFGVCAPLLIDHWLAVPEDQGRYVGTISRASTVQDIEGLLEDME